MGFNWLESWRRKAAERVAVQKRKQERLNNDRRWAIGYLNAKYPGFKKDDEPTRENLRKLLRQQHGLNIETGQPIEVRRTVRGGGDATVS